MAAGWRAIAKAVAVTATLTTAFWFVVAAWWLGGGPPRIRGGPASGEFQLSHSEPEVPGSAARLVVPVAGVRADQLVDTFAQARASGARSHDAIDIPAPRGTPVVAAAAGRVEKLFLSKDGGNAVYVRSRDGRRLYYYAHLDSFDAGLRNGMPLRQGDPLGTVGSTGNADSAAPHLHFAIWMTTPERKWWEPATALNPYPLLAAR